MTQVLPPDSLAVESEKPAEVRAAACLNCGTPLSGPFCAACGQRDIPPYPSVRELVVDAFSELSGWDGRLATTARALIRHPGTLTREFLEGRRARFISPLRVYLMASLAYFVLAAGSPEITLPSGKSLRLGLYTNSPADTTAASRAQRVGATAGQAMETGKALTPEQREAALAQVAEAPALLQPFLRRAVEDPTGFRRGVLSALPRMLFALLPVFALIVAIFYRGRKYPEHLYFAIHLHAFIFLALAVAELAKFARLASLAIGVGILVLTAIPVHATLAFRRVYGGSLVQTLAKEVAIGGIYAVVSFATFIVTVYVVSLAG